MDEINSGATIYVVCPTQPILWLLMLWRLSEPVHQQTWYWPPKLECSAFSIRRIKVTEKFNRAFEIQDWFFDGYPRKVILHYSDVIMSAMASQINGVSIVCSSVGSSADQRKLQTTPLVFVRGIYRSPVDSPHKGPVTWKVFPFDDVIMDHLCKIFTVWQNSAVWVSVNA